MIINKIFSRKFAKEIPSPNEVKTMPIIPKITPTIAPFSADLFKIKIEIIISNIGTVPSKIATTALSSGFAAMANKINGNAELNKPTIE